MEIKEERIANALVVRPAGRIDAMSAPGFESAFLERIESRPARLVLDLSEVDFVSSAGLRAILVGVKRGRAVGCEPSVCRLKDHVREVFELSGFENVVSVHSTLEEALRS